MTLATTYCYRIPGKIMMAGEYGILLGLTDALACTTQQTLWVQGRLEPLPTPSSALPPTVTHFEVTSNLWPSPRRSTLKDLSSHKDLCFQVLHRAWTEHPAVSPCAVTIHIHSDLPPSWGIGSSAAVSLGCSLTVNALLKCNRTPQALLEHAFQAQKGFQHGLASGYDILTQYLGGAVWSQPSKPLGRMVHGHKAATTYVEYLRKNMHFFAQKDPDTSPSPSPPTKDLMAETLLALLHPQALDTSVSSSHSHPTSCVITNLLHRQPLQMQDLSPYGHRVISTQNRLLQHLRQQSTASQLVPLVYQACKAIQATPARSAIVHSIHKALSRHKHHRHQYGKTFAFKPTGAGGNDIILMVGALTSEVEDLCNHMGLKRVDVLAQHATRAMDHTLFPPDTD